MIATVRKWGNSLGIRIPKNMLETVRIFENDQVDLIQDGDKITIKKLRHQHIKLWKKDLLLSMADPLNL